MVADVVEAIIGAAYLTGGQNVALKVMKILDVDLLGIEQWDDFQYKLVNSIPEGPVMHAGNTKAVEAIIGFKFTKPYLLDQALVSQYISLLPNKSNLTSSRRMGP